MNPFERLAARFMAWWRGVPYYYNSTESEDEGTVSLNSPEFLEALGVRKPKATSEVTYFTCLKRLSETLGKMPIKFYQETGEGVEQAEETDAAKLLTRRPNPFMTPTAFWAAVENNRNHYGNGYVYIHRSFKRQRYGGDLVIKSLWIMQSDATKVIIDDEGIFGESGEIYYHYTDPTNKRQYVFNASDVMHFKTSFTFDGITGKPVRQILRDTVAGASDSQSYLNSLYQSGLTAKATLEYTGEMNKTAKENLVKALEEFGSGAKNSGRILPIPMGMKLTPLDIKLADSQFFELKKYTALQIAAAFGITPNQINDYSKSSYANSEIQQLSFYVETMLFIIKQYEEEINYKILSDEEQDAGYYYKFNEKVLFRTDSKTQMDYFGNGVRNAIFMPNEARKKLDMKAAPGGDRLYVNGATVPLEDAGIAYLPEKQTDDSDPDPPDEGTESREGGEEDEEPDS